jgi:non-heme chloroperoxidase
MKTHSVTGGGGCKIHVTDQGPQDAPALLFIHGWAQHNICWQSQSPLADTFRLIAIDLRGHGASDTPQNVQDYTNAAVWGDDIHAVISELDLKKPILIGWSYGARVIASYLATHGQDAIAGIAIVGGVLAIGAPREPWMMGENSPALNRDLYTSDQTRLLPATAKFVADCAFKPLQRTTYGTMVGANMLASAFVRRSLFAGDWDCRAHWAACTKPAVVIHGEQDAIVPLIVGQTAAKMLPNARFLPYPETGHMPFAENPTRFNADLTAFATQAFGAIA